MGFAMFYPTYELTMGHVPFQEYNVEKLYLLTNRAIQFSSFSLHFQGYLVFQ